MGRVPEVEESLTGAGVTDWLRFRGRQARKHAERELTDARPVSEHARRLALDPAAKRRLKLRLRALVLGLVGVCVAGSVAAFVGRGGYLDMLRLRGEIGLLRAEIEVRRDAVERLQEEVWGLEREPAARERIAREQLGLVRPGEIDFLLPREPGSAWREPPTAGE